MNIFTLVVLDLILISQSKPIELTRRKRANFDNFKVLLNIYKMNPLKQSNVYKTFSNRILLPRPDDRRAALHYNSDESVPNRTRNVEVEECHDVPDRPTDQDLYINDYKPEVIDPGQILDMLLNQNDFKRDPHEDLRVEESKQNQNILQSKEKSFIQGSIIHTRNAHLKVYNLNARNQDNNVNYNNAEVVVVK